MNRSHYFAFGTLLLVLGVGDPSMAIESAQYTVTMQEGQLELRDYPPTVVAVVAADGTRSHAVNSGFRLLADYIFGNNQQASKIAMTAPVVQTRRSTRPVTPGATLAPDFDLWTVSFLMPAGYTLQSLPEPNDHRVHFEQSKARRFAAIRFSGFWSDTNIESHEKQLLQWMLGMHLAARSAPIYAYYDPPWTPWFMRRIEVLIEIPPISQADPSLNK